MLESTETLILLPTYNEAGNLPSLIKDLREQSPTWSILVVDDDSPDGTGELAEGLAKTYSGVEVLHRAGKLGLGTAHQYGMQYAVDKGFKTLLTMDVDYTHRPEDVQPVLAALEERGLDIAVGSRYGDVDSIRSWPLWRQLISRTAHFSTRFLLGIPVDATSAFRAYRVDRLAKVPFQDVKGDGYSFMFEMLMLCMQCGLRIDHVGVEMPFRSEGESKISRAEVAKGLAALGRLTFRRIVTSLTGCFGASTRDECEKP